MGFFNNIFRNSNPVTELAEIIGKGAFLVDVRTPGEFAEGHVKGSVNIPLDQIPQQLAEFRDKENIVVFCRSGNRSGMAKSFLNQNGFTNVINGGTWEEINDIINKK